jgi:L-threonylcarbamoyladenylate synthase
VKLHNVSIEEARIVVQQGGVLAYPTEAVYGLGCDAFNPNAVQAIRALKGRDATKAFIVLIADWSQLYSLISPLTNEQLSRLHETWPGFVTWVFPMSTTCPEWLGSEQKSIAIRMSAHPVAQALAALTPIISTSANLSGHPPATTAEQVIQQFTTGIDAMVNGRIGEFIKPSEIFDVRTGQQLR